MIVYIDVCLFEGTHSFLFLKRETVYVDGKKGKKGREIRKKEGN